MTRESAAVFLKFGTAFGMAIFILIVINSITGKSAPVTPETPWKTFNPTAADLHAGRVLMERNGCFACHALDGFGGSIGPVLNGVNKLKNREEMFRWIDSPWSVKPGTKMPQYNLSDDAILKIIGYLETKDSTKGTP